MDAAREDATVTITDRDMGQPGMIGPIELRFRGRWDRVESALEGLPHDPIVYRWMDDSSGEPALFVEVPVAKNVAVEELLHHRDVLQDAVRDVSEWPVYIHFLESDAQQSDESVDA